jgi:hypothetical protein
MAARVELVCTYGAHHRSQAGTARRHIAHEDLMIGQRRHGRAHMAALRRLRGCLLVQDRPDR